MICSRSFAEASDKGSLRTNGLMFPLAKSAMRLTHQKNNVYCLPDFENGFQFRSISFDMTGNSRGLLGYTKTSFSSCARALLQLIHLSRTKC